MGVDRTVVTRFGRRLAAAAISALLLLSAAGCLYPQQHTPGNDVSVRSAVASVQQAVQRYQEATGLLPIISADASVPEYEKFKIDFAKMKRAGYIDQVPKIAFESGGIYIFLMINEETSPVVKLLDVVVHQAITDVQKNVNAYRDKNGGAIPAGAELYPGFYDLDFNKLGTARPDLRSMYSQRPLELMVDEDGRVYGDYGSDIYAAMNKLPEGAEKPEDLRRLLVEASDYVPVKAPVYVEVDGSPQATIS